MLLDAGGVGFDGVGSMVGMRVASSGMQEGASLRVIYDGTRVMREVLQYFQYSP